MLTYIVLITTFHTILSLIALGLGLPAIVILLGKNLSDGYTKWFLITAVATSVTGYFFPFHGVTPAIVVGGIALLSLAGVIAARYRFHYKSLWAWVYAGGIVLNVWLLVFVTIAQIFDKVPFAHDLAPTKSEPPFAIAQLVALVFFVVLGIRTLRKFQPHSAVL